MKPIEFITVQDLYAYAKENNLLDARIRICDGMAVSYYPDPRAVSKARYEIVIDVSANEPIGYDELDEYAQNWHRIAGQAEDELDAYAHACYDRDRSQQHRHARQQVEADRRREYLRARQAKINAQSDPDELPWPIYGYGPYHPKKY